MNPLEFAEMAAAILEHIGEVYSEFETPLPLRRYLAVGGQGETVHDCEQVTVSFEQGFSGLPGDQAQNPVKCDSPRSGVFVVEVVRCVPTAGTASGTGTDATPNRYGVNNVNAPEASAITAMAIIQMTDAMLMMEAALRFADNTLSGATVDISAGSASGAYQAMIMSITTSAYFGG